MLRLVESEVCTESGGAAIARDYPTTTLKPSRGWRVRNWFLMLRNGSHLIPLWARLARRLGLFVGYAELSLRKTDAAGVVTDYGVVCRKVVTDAGVNYIASCFDNTAEPEVFKYHGFGSGTTAESAGQTALVTEFTTEYATDNVRPTGSQAHSTNTYTTVGTFAPDATVTVTEHAPFSQAATGGGTMLDRSKFTGVALTGSADTLAATYVFTLSSGG